MSILSFKFAAFVATIFILVWVTKGRLRKSVLLISNVLFVLSFGNYIHLIYLALIIVISYYFSKILSIKKNKTILGISILIPLIVLIYFKYINVFVFDNIFMPIGISFYTFKIMSHLVDTYKSSKVIVLGALDYFIYVSFFPCLTSGPIHRSYDFIEQLSKKMTFDYISLKNGAVLCAFGLFQKIVIADYFYILMNSIIKNAELKGLYVVLGLVLYSFQLYVDFDSYSNIAIGISKMLGFEIKRNFHTPYLSTSLKEFWHRWHISLSTWIRDYIYIPLGGSRHGNFRKNLCLLVAFGLSGLWHGSSLVFLLWGLGHACGLIVEDFLSKTIKIKSNNILLRGVKICFNFSIVTLLWVFFMSPNLSAASAMFSRMLTPQTFEFGMLGWTVNEMIWVVVLLLVIIISDLLRNKIDMIIWLSSRNYIFRWVLYAMLLCIVMVFGVYGPGYDPSDFAYVLF